MKLDGIWYECGGVHGWDKSKKYDEAFMLYDMKKDPKQFNNLAKNPEYSEKMMELRQRVSDEIATTFASHYAERISLADMLDPEVARAYAAQATGEKRLVVPTS